MALRAGYYGLKNSVKKSLEKLAADAAGMKIIKSLGDGLSFDSDDNELDLDVPIKSLGAGLTLSAAGELSAQVSSEIKIATHTQDTNSHAWLTPKGVDDEILDPDHHVILSIYGAANMQGSPPYLNAFNLCVDNGATDPYFTCKLLNSQTGGAASDGTYSVTYTIAYIEKPATNTRKSRKK